VTRTSVLAILAAAVLAAPLTLVAPAHADVRVTVRDFPTVNQVVKHYPQFRQGVRDLSWPSRLEAPGWDCGVEAAVPHRPQRARTAYYIMRNRGSAYLKGYSEPTVTVFRFGTSRLAALAFDDVVDAYAPCYGRHRTSKDVTRTKLRLPRLGVSRFALRTLELGDPVFGPERSITTWVRTGRTIVHVTVRKDHGAPAAKPAIALTRLAVRAVR